MGLSIKEKREVILNFIKQMPKIFSDKIYASIVLDRDISILELTYDEVLQTKTLKEAFEALESFDRDQFLISNGMSLDEANWFKKKFEIIQVFKSEISIIYQQIIQGTKINEKLIEFYENNKVNIDNWYFSSDVSFDDTTSIQKLFCDRFNVYDLENAPMRLINVIYSDGDIIELIQSYHKDKIDLWY